MANDVAAGRSQLTRYLARALIYCKPLSTEPLSEESFECDPGASDAGRGSVDTFIQRVRLAEIHVSTKLSKLAAIPRGDTSAGSEGRTRLAPCPALLLIIWHRPLKGHATFFFFFNYNNLSDTAFDMHSNRGTSGRRVQFACCRIDLLPRCHRKCGYASSLRSRNVTRCTCGVHKPPFTTPSDM